MNYVSFGNWFSADFPDQEISNRRLARQTKAIDGAGQGVSHVHLATIRRGEETPTPRVMELVCQALEIDPSDFVEYRAHMIRERLDWRHRPVDEVAREVEHYERAYRQGNGSSPLEPDPGSIQALERMRSELVRGIGDYDAAEGFTAPGERAADTVIAALDTMIAAEDEAS